MNKITLSILGSFALISTSGYAATYSIDARGDAMGGVGVVSATYLTAPFYNPALAAIYRRNDDVGFLLPSLGVMYSDEDQMVDNISTMGDVLSDIDTDNISTDDVAELQSAMDNLDGNRAKLELGGAVAFGLPNPYLSATVFGKAYSESFVTTDIYSGSNDSLPSEAQTVENAELSAVKAVSVAVLEAGITLAKYNTVLGHQHVAFGISPKIQRINTYVYTATMNNYSLNDVLDNSTSDATFNIDAGLLWFYGPFRVGVSATNLISRDIETDSSSQTLTSSFGNSRTVETGYTYQIRPQYTVGAGIVADYFTLSVDYDLNEDKKFTEFDDNTQWARVGMEIDVFRQIQLRAGYKKNVAYEDSEGTVTGGIGISPLGLFQLDLGVSYTNQDAKGGYINFLTSY